MQLFKFPIIPVSKMTLMNGELARMCIQIHLLQTGCIKRLDWNKYICHGVWFTL